MWSFRSKLLSQSIGGEGVTVQIDETAIVHQKHHRGAPRSNTSQWVFGGIDSAPGGLGFAVRVPDRKKTTLLPLIQQHIKAGSTIFSDEWKSYDCLAENDFEHHTVCHKREFVHWELIDGVETKVHTNKIEGFWHIVKAKIKRLWGTSDVMLEEYVFEAVWRYNCRRLAIDPFEELLKEIRRHAY